MVNIKVQLTLVISNSMGPWKKFESTVVRLKRSYENTGSECSLFNDERETTRAKFSSEDILKDMLEVKKFPLLLQLLIKSNIFSNLSKLRN